MLNNKAFLHGMENALTPAGWHSLAGVSTISRGGNPMNKFFARCVKRFLPLGLAASTAALLLVPASASAAPYVVKLVQQGNQVVATGSGAFDLDGLTFAGTTVTGGATLWAANGFVMTGPQSLVALDSYTGYAGPTSFGSGATMVADVDSGDTVGIFGSPSYYGYPNFWVPSGYVSGGALLGTSIYDNATFTSLGVTPGTYVWTWGTGAEQSFTLDIGTATSVPEPASLGIFGFGALLLGAFLGLRRRVAAGHR